MPPVIPASRKLLRERTLDQRHPEQQHRRQHETEEQRQQAADKRKECGKSAQTGAGHWPVAAGGVVVAGAAARDALGHQQEQDEGQQHGRQLGCRHPVA